MRQISELPNNWQDSILELYKDGASDKEVIAWIYEALGTFSYSTWYRWLKDEEEFSAVIEGGKMLSEANWERKGRKNLENKDFNYTGWYMNMKNRFKWSDKQEIDHTTKGEAITVISLGNGVKPNDDE